MRKRGFLILTGLLFLSGCAVRPVMPPEEVKNQIQGVFKNLKVVEVKPSEVPCLYEVYYNGTNPGIFYFYPEKKLIVFGEIWNVNGTSITGEKRIEFLEKMLESNN